MSSFGSIPSHVSRLHRPAAAHKEGELTSSLQVCLRIPGFVPLLVKLEPGAEPSRPRPIHVRLQQETRAASQRDLGQESCNVPTPRLE